MKRIADFWWPDADEDAHGVLLRDVGPAVERVLAHTEGRRRIVQAGANVGVYPKALARHFAKVVTLEPDDDNYDCLIRNVAGIDGLSIFRAALGAALGYCTVQANPKNCGAHTVTPAPEGEVRVWTIDALGRNWDACDAIWLDVEGSELAALKGAVETILKFSPTIVTEEKGLGGVPPEELPRFLAGLGYTRVERIGNDWIYKREGQQ